MLWDNHMHTWESGDCEADPLDMINSAKEKGLAGITFTNHLDLNFTEDEPDLFILDLPNYFDRQKELSQKYTREDFTILNGIELGLQTNVVEENRSVIKTYDFDFIIGSIHVIDRQDPYYPSFWDGRDANKAYQQYYETMYENISALKDIDSLGHMDYIFRYHRTSDDMDTYSSYKELVDEILRFIIKNDIALELNTGALRSGLINPNPGPIILKRYKELGGKLITLGADAHTPMDVAFGYDKIPGILKDCGFDSFVVYKNRKPFEVVL